MNGNTVLGARIVRWLLRLLLKPLFRVQITGDAQQFKNERTLIVANHESFLDGMLLGAFLPVAATFVVHTQVVDKWYFRWLLIRPASCSGLRQSTGHEADLPV